MLSLTFTQFTYLTETDQDWILWTKGVLVAKRCDVSYNYSLYQVDGFYVEVKSHLILGTITDINSFEDTNLLNPYLEELTIRMMY